MRIFLFLLFLLFSACSEKDKPVPLTTLPDKDLETIILRGRYVPENEERVTALKKRLHEEGRLKEGKPLEEEYPHVGKERFTYSGIRYCYNKMEGTKTVFNKNLRARLYSEKGQMLSEDFLRLDGPKIPESQSVISYIPHHNEGYQIHIVRLEETTEKEIILKELYVASESTLIVHAGDPFPDGGYVFDKESLCYISPGPM